MTPTKAWSCFENMMPIMNMVFWIRINKSNLGVCRKPDAKATQFRQTRLKVLALLGMVCKSTFKLTTNPEKSFDQICNVLKVVDSPAYTSA